VMGIMATQPKANCIIVSQDKDMKTIPAQVWTGRTGRLHTGLKPKPTTGTCSKRSPAMPWMATRAARVWGPVGAQKLL
jgi:hypothetical protein